MTYFNLSFDKVIIRYYLMMAIVLAAFYIGLPYLGLLAVPVFLSAIMGISFTRHEQKEAGEQKESNLEVYPPRAQGQIAQGKLVY